jgi:lysophospholipase L1-like esterase
MTTWLIAGDEFVQGMYSYFRTPLASRAVGDVIGSKNSTFKTWVRDKMVESVVDEDNPEVVVIALGTNPAGALTSGFAEDVRAIVTQARKRGAQVVLVGPFANDADGKKLAALRSFVPDVINGYTLAAGLPRDSDGVHFTQPGYKTLAERVVAATFQVLDSRRPTVQPQVQPPRPQPLQPGLPQPQPSQPKPPQQWMSGPAPVAPLPVWVWGVVGVVGLSAFTLVVLALRKRRLALAA